MIPPCFPIFFHGRRGGNRGTRPDRPLWLEACAIAAFVMWLIGNVVWIFAALYAFEPRVLDAHASPHMWWGVCAAVAALVWFSVGLSLVDRGWL